MNTNMSILGNYIEPENSDCEGTLTFKFKAGYIEKSKLWKNKDLSSEFIGNFWTNVLGIDSIKPKLHFICAELLENAVYHSIKSDYIIMIQLCFKADELLIYVQNKTDTQQIDDFRLFIQTILDAKDLQKLFVQAIKNAKNSEIKKSQVGLITIIKDRGASLAWKLNNEGELTSVTTLARISLKKEKMHL